MEKPSGIAAAPKRSPLQKLRDRADMMASFHGARRDADLRLHSLLLGGSLLFSVLLLMLALAPADFLGTSDRQFRILIAFASGTAFLLTLFDLVLRPPERAAAHQRALRHYTDIRYRIEATLAGPIQPAPQAVEALRQQYLKTDDVPTIPDALFLKLKKAYKEKVAVSVELDNHPHESIRSIRRRLRRIQATQDYSEELNAGP